MPHIRANIKKFLLLLLIAGAQSCIREGISDCDQRLYIYFTPENVKHNYPQLVQTVDLYFYDEQGNLAATRNYNKNELYTEHKAAIVDDLPIGRYTLMSIINNVETYQTTGEQQLHTLQSNLREKEIKETLVDFFSGTIELIVTPSITSQRIEKTIIKHNNNIHLEIQFDDDYELPQQTTLNTYIAGNNGAYHYQSGTCLSDSYTTYLPHHIENNPDGIPIKADFTTMRIWRNSDLTLYFQEQHPTQGIVRTLRLNIADELARVVNDQNQPLYDTDQKLSYHDEYNIRITLGPQLILLQLVINDWTVIGGDINV